MKQKIGLFLCLALLLTGCSYQTKTIRFGAADIGGMYYTVANAYAGLASKESSDLKFEVKNTAGSAAVTMAVRRVLSLYLWRPYSRFIDALCSVKKQCPIKLPDRRPGRF